MVVAYAMMSIFERDKTSSQPIVWTTTLFLAAFHIGTFAALLFCAWKALALAMVGRDGTTITTRLRSRRFTALPGTNSI